MQENFNLNNAIKNGAILVLNQNKGTKKVEGKQVNSGTSKIVNLTGNQISFFVSKGGKLGSVSQHQWDNMSMLKRLAAHCEAFMHDERCVTTSYMLKNIG